ncbi:MAG: NAD(P)/FAD-dependent oxidoreductase [Kiritimatiellia bacterium]
MQQLDLPPDYTPEQLVQTLARALRCPPAALSEVNVVRRSVDARGRSPRLTVAVECDFSGQVSAGLQGVEPVVASPPVTARVIPDYQGLRPLVVGAGPAGLMAAWGLAEAGLKPLVVERGEAAAPRARRVQAFWQGGVLDGESNVLYGEGGAGLFSDGKLTSRSKDRPRVRRFLEALVACGASPDILIDADPHVGSDVLEVLVPAIRNRILALGGEVRFGVRLDRLEIENQTVRGAVLSGEAMRTDCCVLATGHSARDCYAMLLAQGVPLEAKPFAIGLRLELPQHRIDTAQWGGSYACLGRASFRLTRREEAQARACYSFCMCPGGLVMACASSAGCLTTNGMSLSRRDKPMGNAAFLVPVFPADYPVVERTAWAGIAFQEKLEEAAFVLGGSNYALPAQRLVDFLEGASPAELPAARSCLRARPAQLRGLLPQWAETTLRLAVPKMLRSLHGVALEEVLLYGAETRSSSPVRVVRGEDGQSIGVRGLYPCGEGAGYAGGIVSSGVDGLRIAEAIVGIY